MLIDSSHKKWFLSTVLLSGVALAAYGWLSGQTPGGLTGGSRVGLCYGILGAALTVFAGLLSIVRRLQTWSWLGPRKAWLKGHIWLSLLAAVLILCHTGFRWGGILERLLWIVFLVTLASGIFGLVLQQFVPRVLTARVRDEAPYEQIPQLCRVMRRKADALVQPLGPAERPAKPATADPGTEAREQLVEFYDGLLRPYLAAEHARGSPLANTVRAEAIFGRLRALPGLAPMKDTLAQLESYCDQRRQLAEQERLHHWLHGWLLVHVPFAGALLILGLAHAAVALYY